MIFQKLLVCRTNQKTSLSSTCQSGYHDNKTFAVSVSSVHLNEHLSGLRWNYLVKQFTASVSPAVVSLKSHVWNNCRFKYVPARTTVRWELPETVCSTGRLWLHCCTCDSANNPEKKQNKQQQEVSQQVLNTSCDRKWHDKFVFCSIFAKTLFTNYYDTLWNQ